jgi:hypothetical protein
LISASSPQEGLFHNIAEAFLPTTFENSSLSSTFEPWPSGIVHAPSHFFTICFFPDRHSLILHYLKVLPEGPPHYIDLTLEYIGAAEPISITAYDGQWRPLIGTYEVDPDFEPSFTIDGSGLHRGHIGGNPVLEY